MRNSIEITREHIEKALKEIESVGMIPPRRDSVRFDLLYNGKRYRPKYVLSRALRLVTPKGRRKEYFFRGGKRTNDFLKSKGFKVIPTHEAAYGTPNADRRFWVVSPNVRGHNVRVAEWKKATEKHHAAFMGWDPEDHRNPIGPKFAKSIVPGDVILIARSSNHNPDIVGFGVVEGKYQTHMNGFIAPAPGPDGGKWHGSIRRLSPFIRVTARPLGLPIMSALKHIAALCELHPSTNPDHRKVCDWMSKALGLSTGKNGSQSAASKTKAASATVWRKPHVDPAQFDFSQRSAEVVRIARKLEAALVRDYKKWLVDKGHVVEQLVYGRLLCDAHEKDRNNLIEAKSSNRREYIRMAVGQLLDYAFLGRKTFDNPHKAILLPRKPEADLLQWLDGLKIKVIWKQRKRFVDNAQGRFV